MGQWLDHRMTTDTNDEGIHKSKDHNQNQNVYASNFIPLWIELFHSDESFVEKTSKSLKPRWNCYFIGEIRTTMTGFGWSNGVVLAFLEKFDDLKKEKLIMQMVCEGVHHTC